MRKATEALIHTTFLQNNHLFSSHDNVTELDWDQIWEWAERTHLTEQENAILYFLGYLDGQNGYDLDAVNCLEKNDLLAILESLKIEWNGIDLQENL